MVEVTGDVAFVSGLPGGAVPWCHGPSPWTLVKPVNWGSYAGHIYVYIIYVGFIVCWGQTYTYTGGLMEFNC